MCTYIYTYIYIIYIYIYAQVYIKKKYIYIYVCMYICIDIHMHSYTYIRYIHIYFLCLSLYIYIYIYIYNIQIFKYKFAHISKQWCVHTCGYMHVIYINPCSWLTSLTKVVIEWHRWDVRVQEFHIGNVVWCNLLSSTHDLQCAQRQDKLCTKLAYNSQAWSLPAPSWRISSLVVYDLMFRLWYLLLGFPSIHFDLHVICRVCEFEITVWLTSKFVSFCLMFFSSIDERGLSTIFQICLTNLKKV